MTGDRRFRWRTSLGLALLAMFVAARFANAAVVELDGHRFTLPAGLEIERVAGPPLVDRPICADFDEEGRLYVAESSGSNDPIEAQLKNKPHRIVRLEDRDGDGRFETSTVFADRMMLPQGAMWHDGSLYVAAAPEIWKLTDTDNDGIADRREIWFDGKTLTHCANDLHGPYAGLDGWIYWCKGAHASQTYERPDGPPLVTRAAHIFRRRPEGGLVEPVMTGGMDNPVEVAFTPGGERIFTTTFFQHSEGGLRDGLIHAIYGGVYGKEHGVIDGHPRTGPLMPVLTHLGAAAPCGLARLESTYLGPAFRDNLLACQFNMHKVTRHELLPHGASYRTRDEDLLVSDNLDFHPTDVLEDADGSLLVIDTGGWYKLCCPTSQLWKPDVLGAIYRIRRTAAQKLADPRGRQIDFQSLSPEALVDLLRDPRFAVRRRAREMLGQSGEKSVSALEQVLNDSPDLRQRLDAVWALSQIDSPRARGGVRRALEDADDTVRQAALHATSVWRDRNAEERLLKILESDSLPNRRAAAEALGRVGSAKSVAPLLAAVAGSPKIDRVLEHSLIYACIEIGDGKATRSALAHDDPRVRHAALIALDQMPGGQLELVDVKPLLTGDPGLLHDTAWWIAEHHPEWAGELAGYFRDAIKKTPAETESLAALSARLARFSGAPAIQRVMGESLADPNVGKTTRLALIDAMSASRLEKMPSAWSRALADQLSTTDDLLLDKSLAAIRRLTGKHPTDVFTERFETIARDERLPAAARLQALAAMPKAARTADADLLPFVCDHLAVRESVPLRLLAVDVLLGMSLDSDQLLSVASALKQTGPMELRQLLDLFARSQDPAVGNGLVMALLENPSASSLPIERLAELFASYGHPVVDEAEPLLARIRQENKDQIAHMEAILALVGRADIRNGQRVFQDMKVGCASCHAMGYLGGRVGPDLTRIGRIRTERDLLESILLPSASFVRSYEPTTVLTSEGQVLSGIIRNETSTEISLQVDALKLLHIPISDIDERQAGSVSIMPAGLDKQLTPEQLADLVRFLKAAQ